ncbi:FAD-dependent oxidoreductase [Pseudoalteromonas ruthenica]|uniref:Tungsten formylmethanofuran dehydrogenase n=1 Tax=Pseudoalteromonas ruthenica TaxID=151081 RepID=A0A0F4PLX5_9GAMM|nr:FAD-dependent oxidoreductase [Pseudoalteromonas ruthenica]KJY95998.1 tungsten formylmethanofuran dehydrogenase [Pseudoalteromonas ruthenica]KJY96851.1 tungsten formylmethanofuran dehydrogenase [Pseudoalteromonas ruthenica]TMO88875.1 FAD-dependent oxidoreductase [Pseudoalteromonas ruthenica]TMO91404.1 FAD-dependent oxidoreductase [Pseudoalteromonas ruthenica]TMP01504.1 FAD-dependent oxidoreductase [Pseudoalteromonas ruthenica]
MSVKNVLIVGGGMVGAACAIKLAQQGMKVTVFERHFPDATTDLQNSRVDIRVSAINRASERLLDELGAMAAIKATRSAPYTELEAFEQPNARLLFTAEQLGLTHLGHLIENNVIQAALWQQFSQYDITAIESAEPISAIDDDGEQVTLTLGAKQYQGDLLIAADGGRSAVRSMLGIGSEGWQYQQHCMGILVKLDAPQQVRTWQQFQRTGPVAFLPMQAPYANLIWYHHGDHLARLKALPKEQLKQEIITHFPSLPGDFDIESVAVFPLTRAHAQRYVQGRCVLIGDAAHTINPLAGQGVNLGFADVVALSAQLQNDNPIDIALQRYWQARRYANLAMMSTMDACYWGFSNESGPLKWGRNLFLRAANQAGPIKDWVLKYAIGH